MCGDSDSGSLHSGAGEPRQRDGLFPESEEDGKLGFGNDYDLGPESPRYRRIHDRANDDARRGVDSAAEYSVQKDTLRSSPNIRLDRSREVNRYREGSLQGGGPLFDSSPEDTPRIRERPSNPDDVSTYQEKYERRNPMEGPPTAKSGVEKGHGGPPRKSVSRFHRPEKLELEDDFSFQGNNRVPQVDSPKNNGRRYDVIWRPGIRIPNVILMTRLLIDMSPPITATGKGTPSILNSNRKTE